MLNNAKTNVTKKKFHFKNETNLNAAFLSKGYNYI